MFLLGKKKTPKDPSYKDIKPKSHKFVDDGVHLNVVNMRRERLLRDENGLYKETKATRSQQLFNHIRTRANGRGKAVNDKRTDFMWVSASISFQVRAALEGVGTP